MPCQSFAFWVWTPETNQWINPKYAVKDTPSEQLKYALGFYEMKDYKQTVQELQKLLKHYPRAREAPDAQYYIGKCFEDQGELFNAFKAYQEAIEKYPFSERSSQIIKIQYDIGLRLLEGQKDESLLEVIKGGDHNVIEVFRAVIKNAPYGELAPISQYKIGLFLMEKKLYQEARDEFEKVINDYPSSEWAKAAQYQIASTDAQRSTNAQYDQKITQAAVEEFKEFVKVYPDAELSAQAKTKIQELRDKEAENNFVIAEFYEKQKNYSSAKIYYQTIVDDYSDSAWSKKALLKIQEVSQKESAHGSSKKKKFLFF